jgi:hypothetical protein
VTNYDYFFQCENCNKKYSVDELNEWNKEIVKLNEKEFVLKNKPFLEKELSKCLACGQITEFKKTMEVIRMGEKESINDLLAEDTGFDYILTPKEGEEIELEIKSYEKSEAIKLGDNTMEFKSKSGTGTGFCYIAPTTNDKTMIVTTYALHSEMKKLLLPKVKLFQDKKIEHIYPIKIRITHIGRANYSVEEVHSAEKQEE